MFRAIISPIFRSTRLCATACSIMHPRCCRPGAWKLSSSTSRLPTMATSWVHYTTSSNTQSSAPEDGQNNCPKHVELIRIINKPLLLHLVGCLYYLYERKFMILFMDVNKMAVHQLGQRILLTVQYFSVQCAPTSKRSLLCIKFLHPAAACPSGKRSIKMNVITAHWWKDK